MMQKQNILLLSAYLLVQGLYALKLDADGALLVMDDEIVDVFDLPLEMEDFSDSYDYQDLLELRKAQGLIEQTSGSHLEQSSPHQMTLQNDMEENYEDIPFDDDDYEGAEVEEDDDDDESIMHRPNSMAQLSDSDDDDEPGA